jgi:hypothetical protein
MTDVPNTTTRTAIRLALQLVFSCFVASIPLPETTFALNPQDHDTFEGFQLCVAYISNRKTAMQKLKCA